MTSIAFAADAAQQGGGGFASFLPLILIFVIFYFLLIRPQQKKAKDHQTFLQNIKKGDKVVTSGGLHGEVTGITDTVITLEIAENLRVKIARPYILGSTSTVAADKDAGKVAGG